MGTPSTTSTSAAAMTECDVDMMRMCTKKSCPLPLTRWAPALGLDPWGLDCGGGGGGLGWLRQEFRER